MVDDCGIYLILRKKSVDARFNKVLVTNTEDEITDLQCLQISPWQAFEWNCLALIDSIYNVSV